MADKTATTPAPAAEVSPHIKNLEDFRKLHQQQRYDATEDKFKEAKKKNPYIKKSELKIPKVSLPNLIGPRIKWLREHRKFSQTGLATRAGVSRSTVIRCENDGVVPNFEHLEKMVNVLCAPELFILDPYDDSAWKNRFDMEELPKSAYSFLELEELKKKITEHFDETTICHTQNGMTAYLNKTEKELLLKQIFATIDLTAQVMSEYPRPRHRKMPTKK